MLVDTAFVGRRPEDALAFIVEILQSSTEYSIIGKGLDGTILLWNEGARRLYGYEAEEVLGKATSDLLHTPEDIAAGRPAAMMEEAVALRQVGRVSHTGAQERQAVPGPGPAHTAP